MISARCLDSRKRGNVLHGTPRPGVTFNVEDAMKKVLKPHALYLGDNGRCYCGEHSGTTALYTGRDISGQRVLEVTPEVAAESVAMGCAIECERCGRVASLLVAS
jgi:hypothetical protein